MSEFAPKKAEPHIDLIVDTSDPHAASIYHSLKYFVTDFPISLNDASAEDKKRITADFYGWDHISENVDGISELLLQKPPDITVYETLGGSDVLRIASTLIRNMHMFDHKVFVRNESDYSVSIFQPDPPEEDPNVAVSLKLKSAGLMPLIRLMDLSDDDFQRLGTSYDQVLGSDFFSYFDDGWEFKYPYVDSMRHIKKELLKFGMYTKFREDSMAQEISRIAANALYKVPGRNIRIAVLHGSVHTKMRSVIAKSGINTSLTLFPAQPENDGKHYDFYHNPAFVALREFSWKSSIKPQSVYDLLGKAFLLNQFMIDEPKMSEENLVSMVNKIPKEERHKLVSKWAIMNINSFADNTNQSSKTAEKFSSMVRAVLQSIPAA